MEKIEVDRSRCTECGICVDICPGNALDLTDRGLSLEYPDVCTECGVCVDQCPSGALSMRAREITVTSGKTISGLPGLVSDSEHLVSLLGLQKLPVGVRLVSSDSKMPNGFVRIGFPVRHCVSIHMASLGASLYIPSDQHACAAGKAALGMAELPEKVRSGKIPYMHGLASSEKTAARIMDEIPKLPLGSCKGTIVAPLSGFPVNPDVVLLVCNPKSAMWVANSLLFQSGGPRISANFAGMQASCGDSTALPISTGEVNFSLGCYGCRSAGKLKDDEMYVGIPFRKLEAVLSGLKGLSRAMGKLEGSAGRR